MFCWQSCHFLRPGNRAKSWASLEELYAQGKLKAIGVSNYTPAHMKELMQSCKIPPALLQVCTSRLYWLKSCKGKKTSWKNVCGFSFQVEFHPQLCQTDLRSVCKEYGVCFQAYSSLGKGELLSHSVVLEVAKSCDRTPAQVKKIDRTCWWKSFRSSPQIIVFF